MTLGQIDLTFILDLFVLLLIGMGPKIALVPFLDATADLDSETSKSIANTMVRTAVGTALLLVVLGGFLMNLLHFSPGAASVAGGIVLLLIALQMLVSPAKEHEHSEAQGRTPMQMAVYPLGIPYLLNPAGIAALVIVSGQIDSILMAAIIVGVVLLVGALDMWVFRNMDKLAAQLDKSRLVITEALFGVLLAALAVQLMIDGLAELGVITAAGLH